MSITSVGLINPVLQFVDASGVPYAGGTVTFNAAGTNNLLAVYSDAGLSVSLTNPVHLNAAGRSSTSAVGVDTPVYLQPAAYDVTLKDANSVTVYGPITVSGSQWPGTFNGNATLSPAANANGYAYEFNSTINKASSGTHSLFAGLYLDAPTIGAGASTLTEATTLYIAGAPATGTNKYALDVASGATLLGGAVTASSTVAVTGAVTAASTITGMTDIYTVAWTDYSATSTIVGWSAFGTKLILYKRVGKLIFVQFYLQGTSNSTAATFTLPTTQQSNVQLWAPYGFGEDNTTTLTTTGLLTLADGGSTVTLYPSQAQGAWTNTGTKAAIGQFWYQTA